MWMNMCEISANMHILPSYALPSLDYILKKKSLETHIVGHSVKIFIYICTEKKLIQSKF
jgi:hypothetical protein